MTDSGSSTSLPRKPFHNPGIDGLLKGGLPEGHTVLVAGESGTGKTVLSMEWLFRGYAEEGESGLYLTLTESVTEAARNVESQLRRPPDDVRYHGGRRGTGDRGRGPARGRDRTDGR